MVEVGQVSHENTTLTITVPREGSALEATRLASLFPPAIAAPSRQGSRAAVSRPVLADILDRSLHAAVARFTGGLSPAALSEAYLDWATHLANAPGKRLQLTEKAARKAMRFARYAY
jgi:polyhydroxyalkanoate synthase subunit PhaC